MSLAPTFSVALKLGRISNLPTVMDQHFGGRHPRGRIRA
jgi:hypothetical protein